MSIAMATLVLVSLCAVYASTSVSAAQGSSANVQAPALVGAPTSIVGAPAVSSWAPDGISLEVFVRGSDNALWYKSYNQIESWWSQWKPLGGGLTSSPAASSLSARYMHVYARGNDGALWGRWTGDGTATWTPWYKPVSGNLLAGTGPAACMEDAHTQDVFVTGTNGALYWSHWTSNTGYSAFKSLGGVLTSSPAASSFAPGWIQVFGRGGDGALWSRYTTNGGASWSTWYKPVSGNLLAGTGPAACSLDSHTGDVVVTGTDGALYWSRYTEATGYPAFKSVGGKTASSPSVTTMAGGVQLWVRGGDAYPWSNGYYSGAWLGWKRLPPAST